ncbi:SRPBCC family protein [Puia sp.]|uniref:SRPBCC family protein n=1 Tax=Puia sp. TaxID=2045100 RepID=UPI002F42329C
MPEKNFTLSHKDGTFFRKGDSFGVRFERLLDHPVPTVWKALTEPGQLAKWLAPVTIKSDTISLQLTGGTMGGKILQWKENRVLEYEWHQGTVVRWELLTEDAGRCKLIFTHSAVIDSQLQGAATGWHYHMDILALILDGKTPPEDAPKHWESISRDAAARYKFALQEFLERASFTLPRK